MLAYDSIAARIDTQLRATLRMGTKDRRSAAITLAHGHTPVTRNGVDFKNVAGLIIEDWTLP